MLTVIGDLVEDVVVWTDGPTRRGTDNPAVVTRCRGGSGANVAVHAAGLAPVRFIGRIGADSVGNRLVDDLTAVGVDVRVQRAGRTGTVVVVVESIDGERTMYPDRGAAAELGPIDPTWLAGTTVLHVPAYGLASEPGASSILGAAAHVRRSGGTVSVDLSAVTLIEALGPALFGGLLDEIRPSIVFANSDEAAACDLESIIGQDVTVVVKNGPRPAMVSTIRGTVEVDAEPVDPVLDTTGAGDAFAAGFLSAWLADRDPIVACRAGHRLAASVLRTPGAG